MGKKGQTARRIAAALLAQDLGLTSINMRDQGWAADLKFTGPEWDDIERAAVVLVAPVVARLDRVSGPVDAGEL